MRTPSLVTIPSAFVGLHGLEHVPMRARTDDCARFILTRVLCRLMSDLPDHDDASCET
jgi:hypothetical protein